MKHAATIKKMDIPHILIRVLFVMVLIFLGIILWRGLVWFGMPMDSEHLIPSPAEEEVETIPPPRPGVQGIMIMGAKIIPPIFQIDLTKSEIPLNWRTLEVIDPDTDVEVHGEIMKNGQLVISSINDKGHPSAGRLIEQALSTWVYTKYKTGSISFWFNLPSKGRRLIIDIRRLRVREMETTSAIVRNGMLHLVQDLPSGAMGYRRK
jgi:hypothetical protein